MPHSACHEFKSLGVEEHTRGIFWSWDSARQPARTLSKASSVLLRLSCSTRSSTEMLLGSRGVRSHEAAVRKDWCIVCIKACNDDVMFEFCLQETNFKYWKLCVRYFILWSPINIILTSYIVLKWFFRMLM